ncbi:AAA family ATPase [Pseudoalteromonas sp. S554]|uniref:AAA family ATPase n=1 Tax=Pseudoalteromonas sp. S554 TaxID=2066516 RepID=UPI00110CD3B3|nr:AAA family ATPase [Pseudoalteromonas sp. S554]
MKLACVYISEHHQLKNLFIPLMSEFIFDFNDNVLKISKNEFYVPDYYKGLNLQAVIGKNGSGKTSILDFIESIHSYSESSGFYLFFDSTLNLFSKVELNIGKLDVRFCEQLKEYSVRNFLPRGMHTIVKVNNLAKFSSNKKPKMKNVVDLTSERLSSSKVNRTKQLRNLFTYLCRKNKANESQVYYTFKFRGWTPALKNWLKQSFLFDITKKGFFHDNRELFLRYPEKYNLSVSELDELFSSLGSIREPSDIPGPLQGLTDELSDLFLNSFSSYVYDGDALAVLVPPDSKLDGTTSAAILAKGILNIFRYNIQKIDIEQSLSADLCMALVNKLFFETHSLKINNVSSPLNIRRCITETIEKAITINTSIDKKNYHSIVNLCKTFEEAVEKDLDILLEVVRNISCVDLSVVFENDPNDIVAYRSDIDEPFRDLKFSLYEYFPTGSLIHFPNYSGLERVKVKEPLDILYVSEQIDKLPDYLQKNIDHGWQGLSSGEFAKTSLFSSIFSCLIADEPPEFKLFLIDEADLYLHPEWQRKFIFELIELIKSIGYEPKTQFIITTHSPLIIGDFLPEDILALKVVAGKTVISNSLGFGTKLSDFYLEGMHLDSTYGEHSRSKLQALIDAKLTGIPLTREQLNLAYKICNKSLQESLLDD